VDVPAAVLLAFVAEYETAAQLLAKRLLFALWVDALDAQKLPVSNGSHGHNDAIGIYPDY
jgi:hypothetical protein